MGVSVDDSVVGVHAHSTGISNRVPVVVAVAAVAAVAAVVAAAAAQHEHHCWSEAAA